MATTARSMEYQPGETIDSRFTVRECLGGGGTGLVYRVSDETTDRIYALKSFFTSVIPAHVQVHQIKNLLGPLVPKASGICQPQIFEEDRNRKYIISDFADGPSLRRLIKARHARGRGFSVHEVARVLLAVTNIYSELPPFAVHGNLKPENILLPGMDLKNALQPLVQENLSVMLSDFALTRLITFSKFASIQLSRGNAYAYLSPEHITYGGRVEQKADIFALGVLFHEMLTGKTPKKAYEPVSGLGGGITLEVDAVISKALHTDAASRHPGFSSLRSELMRLLERKDASVPTAQLHLGPAGDKKIQEQTHGGFDPDEVLTDEINERLDTLAFPGMVQKFKSNAGWNKDNLKAKKKPAPQQSPSEPKQQTETPVLKDKQAEESPMQKKESSPVPAPEIKGADEKKQRAEVEENPKERGLTAKVPQSTPAPISQTHQAEVEAKPVQKPTKGPDIDKEVKKILEEVEEEYGIKELADQEGARPLAAYSKSVLQRREDNADARTDSTSENGKQTLPTPPAPTRKPDKINLQQEILEDSRNELEDWLGHAEQRKSSPHPPAKEEAPQIQQQAPSQEAPPNTLMPANAQPSDMSTIPVPQTGSTGQDQVFMKKEGSDFFSGTGLSAPAPAATPAYVNENNPLEDTPFTGEPGLSDDSTTKPAGLGFDPLEQSMEMPTMPESENDTEMQALFQMFEEAEQEDNRAGFTSSPQNMAPQPPAQPTMPVEEQMPTEAPAFDTPEKMAENQQDVFPPLDDDPFADSLGSDPFQPDVGEDAFPADTEAKKPKSRPSQEPPPWPMEKRRKRHRDSGAFPKIIAGIVFAILLGMGTLIVYQLKTRQPVPIQAVADTEMDSENGSSLASIGTGTSSRKLPTLGNNADALKLDRDLAEILGYAAAEPTSNKSIEELTLAAETHISKQQYFTPEAPENAVYNLKQILNKEPKNQYAKTKLVEIGAKYYNLAQNEINRKQFKKAREYMTNAATAEPDNPKYEKLLADLERSVEGGATELSCPDNMLFVPAGPFEFGSDPNDPMRMFGEKDFSEYYMAAYCIDMYEYPGKKGTVPQVETTYHNAEIWCQDKGARLCTEEEWEKACKGAQNTKFPYGDEFDSEICNTEDDEGMDRSIAASGEWPQCRTPEGLFDMSGNVKEWTSSQWAAGLEDISVRGGGYRSPGKASRCAVREANSPMTKNSSIGFRCCKSMSGSN